MYLYECMCICGKVCACACVQRPEKGGRYLLPSLSTYSWEAGPYFECVKLISARLDIREPSDPPLYIFMELGHRCAISLSLLFVYLDPNTSPHNCGTSTTKTSLWPHVHCSFLVCKTGLQQHLTHIGLLWLSVRFIADTFMALLESFSSMNSLILTTQGDQ